MNVLNESKFVQKSYGTVNKTYIYEPHLYHLLKIIYLEIVVQTY